MLAYCARVNWVAPGVTFRNVRSPGGHTPDELKSAMQKYIRRCNVPAAAYCARELCALSMSEGARHSRTLAIATNIIHRMMIICSEDIGPAMGPADWEYVRDATRELLDSRKAPIADDETARVQCARYCELAAFLAILPKSRIVSHIRSACVAWRDPAVALRRAIEDGVHMAPDIMPAILLHASAKYARVCAIVEDARDFQGDDVARDDISRACVAIARAFLSERDETQGDYAEWTRELRDSRELFLVRMMAAAHRATFTMNLRVARDAERDVEEARRVALGASTTLDAHQLDDFVYDKHTARGRRSGTDKRGAEGALQFALEGARIEHEDPQWALRDFAEFYIDKKTVEARLDLASVRASFTPFLIRADAPSREYESEDSAWKFEVRAQLVTSMAHTDTYFASNRAGRWYLIKGPIAPSVARDAVMISRIKRAICGDLPLIPLSVASCARLSATLRSPLGMRARWVGPASFIVARALRGSRALRRMTRSSARWPPTEVIDWSANVDEWSREHGPIALTSGVIAQIRDDARVIRDLVLACLFRFALGVRDNAARNFILREDSRIVACDEDNFECVGTGAIADEWVEFLAKLPDAIRSCVVDARDYDEIAQWRARLLILRANDLFADVRDECTRRFARIDARLEFVERKMRA
jgi:hypothetical protein